MSNKNGRTSANLIKAIVIILTIVIAVGGTTFAIINILQTYKEYIAFVVTERQSNNVIKNSTNNALTFDSTYNFDIKYIFAEEDKIKKTYDYSASITGCKKMTLMQEERPIQFDNLDFSEAFKLEKKEKSFSITIPSARNFFEIIFANYLDNNNNKVELQDLCEIDYFSINIMSYNKKDIISYQFHFSNMVDEICSVESIETNADSIDFTTDLLNYPVESIEISQEEIVFYPRGE